MTAEAATVKRPTMGRIVLYRSRTGNYTLPAIVTATKADLWPEGVELGHVPDLTDEVHVHLTVCSPGRPDAPSPPEGVDANQGGTYREWDVSFDARSADEYEQAPGTWRWPPYVPTSTPVGTGLTRDLAMSLVDALDPNGTNEALKLWGRQWWDR